MNIKRWIARREKNWQRLNSLLQQVEKKGLPSLNADEIRELAGLYRSISADLARAKTHKVGQILIEDLQRLTNRSYTQIYQGARHQEWKAIIDFYKWGFPEIVQKTFIYSLIATVIFLLGGIIAWWYAWRDPVFISVSIPQHLISKVRDDGELWFGSILGIEPLASSNIMINNIGVALKAVGGGITAGIFTIYILIFNGLHIGAIATLVGQNNLAYPFWAFVFPHGSLELPAIFLAGGAGLLIGRGLLFPGKYNRVDALKIYANQAIQLVFGIVPMLFIAGIIEGFFSPSLLIPDSLKYLTGISIFAGFVFYCNNKKSPKNFDG